jgi:hypothetical protein
MSAAELAVLGRLADKQAIRDVVNRYTRGLDRHDEDILRSVFHRTAIDNHGSFVGYRDEFVKWGNAWHEEVAIGHCHNITSHICDIEGTHAHASSYAIFVLRRRGGVVVHVGGGRYLDRLEKRNGVWKISLRRFVVEWRLDVEQSAQPNLKNLPRGSWSRSDPSYLWFDGTQ